MKNQATQPVTIKRPELTPKALIHQKYGSKACYKIEEVQQYVDNVCPGLAIPQQVRCMYRCSLDLPDLSVISDTFTRKKEAEQSAAKIAIEKLGIQSTTNDPTPQEAMDELVARISGLFTNEFLSSPHPLTGHIRVALKKMGASIGTIPISVIAASDVKVSNLCKVINPDVESDPLLLISLVMKAAKMSDSLITSDKEPWISRQGSYSPEVLQLLADCESCQTGCVDIGALLIPCSTEKHPESLSLNVSNNHYYMDAIAQVLGGTDSSQILISRTVGKASSEMKLYFHVPKVSNLPAYLLSDVEDKNANLNQIPNKRASYLSGQRIYGDAVLANVGYTWKSSDLFYEDVSLCTYYRLLLNKVPDGHYKLSREAVLIAELPVMYTSRLNWKGPSPRDLLCTFCRQHRLCEPLFTVKFLDSPGKSSELSMTCKNWKPSMLEDEVEKAKTEADNVSNRDQERASIFQCEVKILSRREDPILACSVKDTFRKEVDSIQNAALIVLLWFNEYFKQLDMPIGKLCLFGGAHHINVHPVHFLKEFVNPLSLYDANINFSSRNCTSSRSLCNALDRERETEIIFSNPEGADSGVFPSPGSLTCISYVVALVKNTGHLEEILESNDEFEFEIGTGSVISPLEACITQLSTNQSAKFITRLPPKDLILAASAKSNILLSQLSLDNCFLEYTVKILRVTEPLEDRLEQALFSPPLSKQRVDFAVQHINENHAATLVDFGCGAGSLLDSLLEHSTTLEKIVGVDISVKGLTRAAKILHSKLSVKSSKVQSAVLYDGSITDFDSRLHGFDIGTCLEVIEHMEEHQADLFGDAVLSLFCPQVLIVSTPNYEYNTILQRSSLPNREDDPEDKSVPCKFRNFDHKFEWTRRQFEHWAGNLASRHNYSVMFSGVGGSGDVEPGFASQIAVFRKQVRQDEKCIKKESCHPYNVVWEWSNKNSSVAT
ncbi:putative Methyltransferase domain, HEN1, double-stranded RNA binding domain 2 [Dioscorea sansibarensis]